MTDDVEKPEPGDSPDVEPANDDPDVDTSPVPDEVEDEPKVEDDDA